MAHLSLVPTPIGNLEDITLRALTVLREADVVAAEDTRHSGRLLAHFGIDKPLVRLDAHTITRRGEGVLAEHGRVAFVTDAGTPGISDPGAELLAMALGRGDTVEVLPGPTALIPALVLSGLPLGRFRFEGFLPRKGRERRERLDTVATSEVTVAFYEAPQRVRATLAELLELCGPDRPVSVSRELSKRFETTYRGTLTDALAHFTDEAPRGEFVVVLSPAPPHDDTPDFAAKAHELAAAGLSGRDLQKALRTFGAPRNLAYELSLQATDSESA
ncbi:MAG: 16S rRNA (cytidine(1402)-2'-O)-methyltransferase [Trueperaceae bacterium]|nr:16S rRNA (cytidine(1402)-2'-O)-methyltransferase [Trueperaceae bacterium]